MTSGLKPVRNSSYGSHLKVLKPEDVQDADGSEVFIAIDTAVQFTNDPSEALRVESHRHRVPRVHRLMHTHIFQLLFWLQRV